jgi:hypothetical protein
MKPEYREGAEALDNFNKGMTKLFQIKEEDSTSLKKI